MRKKTRVKCFATGLALAVALSTSGTGLYGGIPQVSAAIWQARYRTKNGMADVLSKRFYTERGWNMDSHS